MSDGAQSQEVSTPAALYWFMAFAVAFFSITAYTGYVVYSRFDLPAVTGAGLLLLAAGAGIASFFSPCAFPLLVTLLSREVGAKGAERGESDSSISTVRALRFASALSLGAAAFLVLTGIVLAVGGGTLFAQVTFTSTAGVATRIVVGVLLVVLGLVQAGVIGGGNAFRAIGGLARRPLARAQVELRQKNPTLRFVVYGFGYLLAGFG